MRQLYAQTSMRLVTQNVRGLTPEKLEMIIHTMKDRGIHAAALQEAWAAVPSGRDNDETDGFLIIWHGETVRPCNRGRLGIVIILSPVARLAWEARGELMRKDRVGRVMTVDLALEGPRTLRLGSAYSPATGASSDKRQAFTAKWRGIRREVSRARIPLTLNPRKKALRSRMHGRKEPPCKQ